MMLNITRRLLLASLFALPILAQTMPRLYLMPIEGTGSSRLDPRRPKYRDSVLNPSGVAWAMMDYGYRPTCLVAAETTTGVHAQLVANSDVFAFPDNFQVTLATVGNQSTAVTNTLEAFAIPAQWVTSQDTYLSVAHSIGGMFQFAQRLNGIMGSVDPFAGATMNTQFRNLSQATQTATMQAGSEFGWNMSGVTNNITLRNLIKYMADQWGTAPLFLGQFSF